MNEKTIDTYLVVKAHVTIDDEVRENYKKYISDTPATDEELAQSMLFASLNPRVYGWQYENTHMDDYWDGCCNMKGKINKMCVDEEAEIW